MRDVVASLLAIALIVVALSLATTLRRYRQHWARTRDSERALGRTIIAEVPSADSLVLFSEDRARFYWGEQSIDKDLIATVRLLINGASLAVVSADWYRRRMAQLAVSEGAAAERDPAHPESEEGAAILVDSQPEGIARDRWDVAIETERNIVLIECGSIRERVSQELARSVFDAVKRALEAGNTQRG